MNEPTWNRRSFIKLGLLGGCIGTGIYTFGLKWIFGDDILSIVSFPDPLLRKAALPVTEFDDSLTKLGRNMITTLKYQVYKGLWRGGSLSKGLAAPQVGISKRIIVGSLYGTIQVMVNPEIIAKSGSYLSEEGCLSLPNHARRVLKRSQEVEVRYYDIRGKEKKIELKARFAAAMEHEIDHLNGVLYIDKPRAHQSDLS